MIVEMCSCAPAAGRDKMATRFDPDGEVRPSQPTKNAALRVRGRTRPTQQAGRSGALSRSATLIRQSSCITRLAGPGRETT